MDELVGRHDAEIERGVTTREPVVAPAQRRRSRVWLWLLLLALALAAGVVAWRELAPAPAGAPAPHGRTGQFPPQPVGVATAAVDDVRVILNALGTVTPLATVTVKTQINGQLQQIAFTEGQMVRKGDFLAQIDPRPYEALLEQYQGQLAHDQGLLKQAQVDLTRYQTLLKQDSISRQQADDQFYLVEQYQGSIRSDQAQIDTQKLNIAYCHVVSPVDGQVGLRQVDQGNYVQTTDANGLVVITQEQPMSVLFSLAEDDLPAVLKQMHAGTTLSVAAYDRANVNPLATGTLATTDNQIDTATGMVKLRALFPNTDETLFPQQFVNARLLVQTLHHVVTVPTAAVQRGSPGTFAYVVDANNTVSLHVLKLGATDGNKVQVISGLNAGDRVVIDGTDRLREGAKVTVQAAKTEGPAAAGPAEAQPGTGEEQGQHHHRHQQQQGEQQSQQPAAKPDGK